MRPALEKVIEPTTGRPRGRRPKDRSAPDLHPPANSAPPLEMTNEQRGALERMARSRSLPRRKIVQARALLLAADGVPTNEVARRCHTTDSSVRAWRRRFADHGVEAVGRIAPGRGRKRSVSQEIVEKIVHDTMYATPDGGGKRWTAPLMGERFGISRHVVSRIWRDHNLNPSKSLPVETLGGSSCPE